MKQQKRNSPAELSRTTGLSKGNTNTKSVFTSKHKCQTSICQPPAEPEKVEIIWHREGKLTPELKRVFAMLLRGRDNGV